MRMRKRAIIVGGLALAVGLSAVLNDLRAQSPGEASGTVAVIDIVKVFNQYRQTLDLNEEFDRRRAEVQAEVDGRDLSIETKAKELEAFHPDSADYNKRRRELLRLRIDRENYMRVAEMDVRDLFRRWTEQTYEQICQAAGQVARERGFHIVIAREDLEENLPDANALKQQIRLRKVIYHDEKTDITEEVLSRLNRAYEQQGKKPELSPLGT